MVRGGPRHLKSHTPLGLLGFTPFMTEVVKAPLRTILPRQFRDPFAAVQDILLEGLRKLEYRGYDSAGISIQSDGRLDSVRAVGNLRALEVMSDLELESRGGGTSGGALSEETQAVRALLVAAA